MSEKSAKVKISPAQASLAALFVAQKLAAANDADLVAFIAAQPALAEILAMRDNAAELAHDITNAEQGFDTLLDLLADSFTPAQADTTYLLCADFIARYGRVSPEEMRFLERLGAALKIDRLTRAAFDRAAQARAADLSDAND